MKKIGIYRKYSRIQAFETWYLTWEIIEWFADTTAIIIFSSIKRMNEAYKLLNKYTPI